MPISETKILSWNVQGIFGPAKLADLLDYSNTYHPDIICLQETFLAADKKLFLPNYVTVRADRANHGGGVAISVRIGIRFRVLKSLISEGFESVSIQLYPNSPTPIIITNIYAPYFARSLKNDTMRLFDTPNHFVIGDWNAKASLWSQGTNRFGNVISSLLENHPWKLLAPPEPTYCSHSNGAMATLDFVITNSLLPIEQPEVVHDLKSDHWAITTTINAQREESQSLRFNYEKANWAVYRLNVSMALRNFVVEPTSESIELAASTLRTAILEAKEQSVPKFTKKSQEEILSDNTKREIRNRRHLLRLLARTNDPSEATSLKTDIRITSKRVDACLKADRNSAWSKFTKKVSDKPRMFWRTVKAVRKSGRHLPTFKLHDGTILSSDEEKANALATSFLTNHEVHTRPPNGWDNHVASEAAIIIHEQPTNDDLTNFHISNVEITDVLSQLKPFKAPGFDGIHNILLKRLPPRGVNAMAQLASNIFAVGHWPELYKSAKIVAIHKTGKPSDIPSSYRPVSLLSAVSKVFEKLFLRRLKQQSSLLNVIPATQFGFKERHSANHQVASLIGKVRANKRDGRSVAVAFLDLQKAFDTVW